MLDAVLDTYATWKQAVIRHVIALKSGVYRGSSEHRNQAIQGISELLECCQLYSYCWLLGLIGNF
jgi:hypothetical protein